jgi:hypothetical protein
LGEKVRIAAMQARAVFPKAKAGAGLYESFYLRAVSPLEPIGVWIRYTIHKRPGDPPQGSLWCTVFDVARGAPFMHKLTAPRPRVPPGAWIEIDGQARLGPGGAEGSCGAASWSVSFTAVEAELRHLRPGWLYRAPLPRTKLTSPAPLALFDGVVEVPGRAPLELAGWPGMVGHNWGSEHAERWIWMHGCQFADSPGTWLDLAVGRLAVGGRMTPWVANGALSLEGVRHRLGGLLGPRPSVAETPAGAVLELAGRDGRSVEVRAEVPSGAAAGWRYADPDGGEHDVVNCSVAGLRLEIRDAGRHAPRVLRSDHGGVYELGMRERDHGVTVAPFGDG